MSRRTAWFLVAVSVLSYFFLSFFLTRTNSTWLMGTWVVVFICYLLLVSNSGIKVKQVILLGVAFRLVFVFTLPTLSDDFYRFVWDGRLWHAGVHPFLFTPSELVDGRLPGIDHALFQLLNSKEYFTVYPPFSQAIFWLSVMISPGSVYGSVVVIKMIMLVAESGTMLLLLTLLRRLHLPESNIGWYALNPLIIIELTGNIHFEGFMIFFLLLAIWLLQKNHDILAALSWALAIAAKLLPIVFLPALLFYLGLKRSFLFYLSIAIISLLLFLPLYNQQVIQGFREGLGYYFQKFEFNASIYYLVREWGYVYYGYNIIQTVGWKLALISTITMLFVAWGIPRYLYHLKPGHLDLNRFFVLCSFMLAIYLLFSTTVHPWYIAPLVIMSCLGVFRFGILWSALIFCTYVGYSTSGYHENLWIVAAEYIMVLGFFFWELSVRKCQPSPTEGRLQHLT